MPSVFYKPVSVTTEDVESTNMEIDLASEARKLIEEWTQERDAARQRATFYSGAISGLNQYLERLGRDSSSGQGSNQSGAAESRSDGEN